MRKHKHFIQNKARAAQTCRYRVPTVTHRGSVALVSSLDVARCFGRRHVVILDCIRKTLTMNDGSPNPNWAAEEYAEDNNIPANPVPVRGYWMTKTGFELLSLHLFGRKDAFIYIDLMKQFDEMDKAMEEMLNTGYEAGQIKAEIDRDNA